VLGELEIIPVPIPASAATVLRRRSGEGRMLFLDPEAARAMSALALIPDGYREAGLRALRSTSWRESGNRGGATCSLARNWTSVIAS
jgi:hypothetical protein